MDFAGLSLVCHPFPAWDVLVCSCLPGHSVTQQWVQSVTTQSTEWLLFWLATASSSEWRHSVSDWESQVDPQFLVLLILKSLNNLSKQSHQLGIKCSADGAGGGGCHSGSNPKSSLPHQTPFPQLTAGVLPLAGSRPRCEPHIGMNDRVTTDQIVPNPSKLFSKGFRKEKKTPKLFSAEEGGKTCCRERQTSRRGTENELFKSIVYTPQRNQLLFQLGSQKTWIHFIFSFQKCKKILKSAYID